MLAFFDKILFIISYGNVLQVTCVKVNFQCAYFIYLFDEIIIERFSVIFK